MTRRPRARIRCVLRTIDLVRVNDRILNAAAAILPPEVRALDAIHLATADEFGGELTAVVTYDTRLAKAAREGGHKIVAPR